MGLDSCIVISEFHFELPKEFLEFFYQLEKFNFFNWVCYQNKCHLVVFLQGLYFVYVIAIG
jgi:hypothetical protein